MNAYNVSDLRQEGGEHAKIYERTVRGVGGSLNPENHRITNISTNNQDKSKIIKGRQNFETLYIENGKSVEKMKRRKDFVKSSLNNVTINFSSIEDLRLSNKLLPPIQTDSIAAILNADINKSQ